jgi:hypothetical protein
MFARADDKDSYERGAAHIAIAIGEKTRTKTSTTVITDAVAPVIADLPVEPENARTVQL